VDEVTPLDGEHSMTEESASGGTVQRKPPGQTTERVGAFVDAVLAIAMTLLVIDIPRPDSSMFSVGHGVSKEQAFQHLGHFLYGQRQALYAYLLAFGILWVVWRQHHALFDQYDRITTAMVQWHFPLLLFAAFLPYSTSVLGDYGDNPMAALLYGVNVGVILLSRSLVQRAALHGGALIPEADVDRYRRETWVSYAVVAYWVATLAFVWWAPWSEIPWFFASGVASLARVFIHRRERTAPV
jgi:uncharacterized membrane protein